MSRASALLSRLPAIRAITAVAVVVSLILGQAACLSTSVPPIGAGPAFTPENDERELWLQAQAEERKLRDKAALYQDPILESYLNDVASRLAPPGVRDQDAIRIRVHAIKDPALNAFTYPTGSIYVHTGLLARLENEAQLAVVVGHEMTHATHRHALEFQRSARNKMIGFSIASLVGSIMVADAVGLERVSEAGYDPGHAPRVFELLKDDHGDDRKMEVFFFGSHPRLDERIADMKELVAARYGGAGVGERVTDTREFRMRTRVLVRDDAAENIRIGRPGIAAAGIDKVLDLTPNDPVARFLTGQVAEKRAAEAKDRARADRLEDELESPGR